MIFAVFFSYVRVVQVACPPLTFSIFYSLVCFWSVIFMFWIFLLFRIFSLDITLLFAPENEFFLLVFGKWRIYKEFILFHDRIFSFFIVRSFITKARKIFYFISCGQLCIVARYTQTHNKSITLLQLHQVLIQCGI